ncbi:AI-2E family transporter, partial [Candidatus Gracilibacteria bacterium]|nr:AI-2E family transporter [Candidatus Gracilibacteria bacterium]
MEHTREKQEFNLIVLLILVGFYIVYLVYAPFLYDLLIAACCVAIFRPLFLYLRNRFSGRSNLSATVCTLIFIFIVAVPTTFLVTSLTAESLATYNFIREQVQSGALSRLFDFEQYVWLQDGLKYINQYVNIDSIDIQGPITDQATKISLWVYQSGTEILASVSLLVIHFFFIILMFYFLIRDTDNLLREISKFSPFSQHNRLIITQKFIDVSQAIFKGAFLTAIAQGVMLGLGFAVLSLPSPIFWGFVTVFFALLPIGTAIIWVPAGIILLVAGSYWKAILLMLWGAIIVSTVDNLLRPYLMSDKAHLPAIVIFFAVLGGVSVFGA